MIYEAAWYDAPKDENVIQLLRSETVLCDKVTASTSVYYAKRGELALLKTQPGCIHLRTYPVIHHAAS